MIKADRIIKSKRKTLSVSVDGNGEIVVRAPYHYTDRQINKSLSDAEGWINKQLEKYEKCMEKTSDLGIEDGKYMLFLGERFLIRFDNIKKERIEERTITLPEDNPEIHLKSLFKRMAKNYLTERTEYFSRITGFTPSAVKINSAKTRWGSCSAQKSINYSLSLIMCPPEIVDYVIVHELCHIKYMNHSALFWDEVGKYVPDYKKRRKWLKDNRFITDLI